MPELGEVRKGIDIGYKSQGKYVYAACVDCGKERWTITLRGKAKNQRCPKCANIWMNNPAWNGGKRKNTDGYTLLRLHPNDSFYPMAVKNKGYVLEHRLVMAKSLHRCLLKTEHVHHKDGNRANNELSNLELISPINHLVYRRMCTNCDLRKEIRLLRWQVKELTQALQEKLRVQV